MSAPPEHSATAVTWAPEDYLAGYRTPDLVLPFAGPAPHPCLPQAQAGLWEWLELTGLLTEPSTRRRLRDTRPDLLAALYYPTAETPLLVWTSCWLAWAFLLDDVFDEGALGLDPGRSADVVGHLCDIVDAAAHGRSEPADGPLAEALVGLLPTILHGRSSTWVARFAADVTVWLRSYITEADERASGRVRSLAAYTAHRRTAYGVAWILDLCEPAEGRELPAGVWDWPELDTAREAAGDCMTRVNDLFSVPVDARLGSVHNAVRSVMVDRGCTVQQAVAAVAADFHRGVDRLTRAESALSGRVVGDAVEPDWVLRAYRTVVAANLTYHHDAIARYRRT